MVMWSHSKKFKAYSAASISLGNHRNSPIRAEIGCLEFMQVEAASRGQRHVAPQTAQVNGNYSRTEHPIRSVHRRQRSANRTQVAQPGLVAGARPQEHRA